MSEGAADITQVSQINHGQVRTGENAFRELVLTCISGTISFTTPLWHCIALAIRSTQFVLVLLDIS